MNHTLLRGGFTQPARHSAIAFRVAINAMSRPGHVQTLEGALPPEPLSVAAGTLLLTLIDTDTSICLLGPYDCEPVQQWLRFHTGANIVSAKEADFVLTDWQHALPLNQFSCGSHEYPDRSATLIVEMDRLGGDELRLSGPGLETPKYLSLPALDELQKNHNQYPLGVDFYLTSENQVAALPRSTKVERA